MKKFGLSQKEKLKSKKDFNRIFNTGKSFLSEDNKIKALYLVERNISEPGVVIGVAVYKKSGIAAWRNRIKRLIRTAYRLNKEILIELSLKKNLLIKIVFSPVSLNQKNNKCVRLNDIMPGVIDIMLKFKSLV